MFARFVLCFFWSYLCPEHVSEDVFFWGGKDIGMFFAIASSKYLTWMVG